MSNVYPGLMLVVKGRNSVAVWNVRHAGRRNPCVTSETEVGGRLGIADLSQRIAFGKLKKLTIM